MKSTGKNDYKYRMTLSAFGNPDYSQNCHAKVCGSKTVYADTIEELCDTMRHWIRENNLGAGNVAMTAVFDNHSGKKVGAISYNGRFWECGSKYCPK